MIEGDAPRLIQEFHHPPPRPLVPDPILHPILDDDDDDDPVFDIIEIIARWRVPPDLSSAWSVLRRDETGHFQEQVEEFYLVYLKNETLPCWIASNS
jgi:hypothetical protein